MYLGSKGVTIKSIFAIALKLQNGKLYYVTNIYNSIDLNEWSSKAIHFHTKESAQDFIRCIAERHEDMQHLTKRLQVVCIVNIDE
jgi:hypothetical protein